MLIGLVKRKKFKCSDFAQRLIFVCVHSRNWAIEVSIYQYTYFDVIDYESVYY